MTPRIFVGCLALVALGFLVSGSTEAMKLDPAFYSTIQNTAGAAVVSPGVSGTAEKSASPAAPPLNPARPWLTDYSEGWRIAAEQQKPMLVVLHRQSCLPCKELLYSTFRDTRIRQRLLDRYVLTVLDVEHTDPRIIQGLSPDQLVLPTMVMVHRGRIVARRSGYLLPAPLTTWLDATAPAPDGTAAALTGRAIDRPVTAPIRVVGCAACGAARAGIAVAAVPVRAVAARQPVRRVLRALPIVRRRGGAQGREGPGRTKHRYEAAPPAPPGGWRSLPRPPRFRAWGGLEGSAA